MTQEERNELYDCIGFVILFALLIFGVPWMYYLATGNLFNFGV